MKKLLGFVSLLALFVVVFALLENNPKSVVGLLMKDDLQEATAVNFNVKLFGFIPVGSAIIENKGPGVFQGDDVLRFGAYARPNFPLSLIFDGEIKINCSVDARTFLSRYYQESFRIGKHRLESREIIYNQAENMMISEGRRVDILPETLDPLAAVNYIRKINFNEVKYFDLNINSSRKNYIFRGEVDEIKYRIRGEEVKAWKLTGDIKRRDKTPEHSSRVIVWIMDNATRTPIFVKILFPKFFYSAKVSDIR